MDAHVRKARDLLVMGMPRGGTTLLTALLDTAPDTACLSEPPLPRTRATESRTVFADVLADELRTVRDRMQAQLPVQERRGPSGERLTNYIRRDGAGGGENIATVQEVVRSGLSPGFTLGVKLNGPFLAMLPELATQAQFECVGLLRHPRETLTAWVNTSLPVSQGSFAVRYWPELAEVAASAVLSRPEKLARVYAAIADRLAGTPGVTLFRYEQVVDDPSRVFARLHLTPGDAGLVSRQRRHAPSPLAEEALDALGTLGGISRSLYQW